jgi:hypothetical protein
MRTPRQAFFERSERAVLPRCNAPLRGAGVERADNAAPGRVRQFAHSLRLDARGRINTLRVAGRFGRAGGHQRFAGLADLAVIAQPFLVQLSQQDRGSLINAADFVVADPLAIHANGAGQVLLVSDFMVFY